MKKETDYINDLKEIKSLMNQSSRFMSLSGWSGISIGILALMAAFIAYQIISGYNSGEIYDSEIGWSPLRIVQLKLIAVAAITVLAALMLGYTFTNIKVKKEGGSTWNPQSKQMILNFALPLVLGGMSVPLLYLKGYIFLVVPMMLLVYGFSLIHASKYSIQELKSLGVLEIILGLIAITLPGYGLFLWAIGFGVLHIVYGVIMKIKYP